MKVKNFPARTLARRVAAFQREAVPHITAREKLESEIKPPIMELARQIKTKKHRSGER